jgi:hypothetical protein
MNTIPIRKGTRTLVNLINRDNNTAFKYTDLVLGTPSIINTGGRNTKVTVWEKKHTSPADGVDVTYNRLDIEKVFKMMWGDAALLQLDVYNCTRLSDLLDYINKTYSLELVSDDIVDMEFDQLIPHVAATLQVSDKSHLYIGTLPIHLYTVDLSKVRITADGRIRIRGDDVSLVS